MALSSTPTLPPSSATLLRTGTIGTIGLPLFYVVVGAAFVLMAQDLPFGSAARMGPGFFPTIAGCGLIGIGLLTGILRNRRTEESEAATVPFRRVVRALAGVLGGFLLFATVERLGLVAAVLALVWVAALAQPGRRIVEMTVLGGALALIAVLIFIEGLGLPLPVLPQ